MNTNLEGKVVLVTGGSSGIGKAIALRAREAGARVAITGRREALVAEAAEKLDVLGIPGDVCRRGDAERTVAECAEKLGGLTTLVNNAGVIGTGATADTPVEEWERLMRINLDGTVNMCRASLDLLKGAQGASIVNVSSVCGNRPFAQITAYCVSKAAVEMYTKCLALELAPDNVRVNAIAPGVVVSSLHTVTNAVPDYAAFLERSKETHPLGFVGDPDDAAWMALYLASDQARWVTGGIFPLDGGRSLASAR
jgi:NAD(P)-dependent dehydrogenase (short-subunit alcohol dehydrogenase family)